MKKSQGFKKRPYKIKRKKSILKNRFFWFGILGLAVLIGVFYLVCFYSFFQIEKIEISGNQKVETENIKNLIEKEISKKVLFFPTKSIFLADCKKTRKEILSNFPKIAEIEVNRGYPDALHIIVVERFEVAIWCDGEQCFLLDNEGVIFENFEKVGDEEILEIKSFIISEEPKLGQKIIEKEKIAQILEIAAKLKQNLKISSEKAEIVSERRLNVKTSERWEIYFNLENDLDWQITELGLILEKLEKQALPGKRENLEYIDLRFDKVNYKCR